MGTYFNPDNGSFRKDTRSQIYVDKTGLLEFTNKILGTKDCCFAVSHARRFGKSQAAGMIDAYYSLGSDSRELFAPFKIAKSPNFAEHLNRYNVIHLDISSFEAKFSENMPEGLTINLFREFSKVYPDIDYKDTPIAGVLQQIYQISGCQFVIIIDEWDCIVRNQANRPDIVHEYMQFLHDLFKSEEAKSFLALAYITGIMPIKKIRNESALNNFHEFTMINSWNLTEFFGFTEAEVRDLCQQYDMDFDIVRAWYNGYLINGQHMYNPNSVYDAMINHSFESYWKNTSSYETINDYITLNFEGLKDDVLKMLAGDRVEVDTSTFQNDLSIVSSKDDALTALIHLGYLGYDARRGAAYMPNYEVSTSFQAALKNARWNKIAESIRKCESLLWATIDGEADKVAQYIDLAHEAYTSIIQYNNENSLSCIITMAYYTAPAYYDVKRELPAGKGFADFAFIPRKNAGDRPAMIVELKYDKSADSAIQQIKEKRYAGALKDYADTILLVGINYDKETKKHSCIIESI